MRLLQRGSCSEAPAARFLQRGSCSEAPAARLLQQGSCSEAPAARLLQRGSCSQAPAAGFLQLGDGEVYDQKQVSHDLSWWCQMILRWFPIAFLLICPSIIYTVVIGTHVNNVELETHYQGNTPSAPGSKLL